jgi:hypothetical protein
MICPREENPVSVITVILPVNLLLVFHRSAFI